MEAAAQGGQVVGPRPAGHAATDNRRGLRIALALTAGFCAVEVAGGLITNSLALLSDAGHMFGDVAALSISLFAMYLARRPPTASMTFGYHRIEILAALLNGLALWLIVGLILHEAYLRLHDPPQVRSGLMIAVAGAGLLINVVSLLVLARRRADSLNVRAAFVHVLGDAVGSIGALAAGTVMFAWGWYLADPLVSFGIGGLILYSSWGIVRESVDILMQGTPREMRLDDIERCLLGIQGVQQVHDLHVWTLTSGRHLLSVHLVVLHTHAAGAIIDAAQRQLRERFGIGHTTVQVDPESECTEEFRAH
jgi:cobalt-zinc-cadmium efflux system protein